MKNLIALLLACLSLTSSADEPDPYVKVTLGYIVQMPDKIHLPDREPVELYGDANLSYTLEAGIKVQTYRIGIAYSDLVSQDFENRHRPQVTQVFIDNYLPLGYLEFRIGAGIKINENSTICLDDQCTAEYNQNGEGGEILNRFTARLGLVKQFDHFTVGLEHHSQWLQGKPLSDEWEFYRTELTIAYEW